MNTQSAQIEAAASITKKRNKGWHYLVAWILLSVLIDAGIRVLTGISSGLGSLIAVMIIVPVYLFDRHREDRKAITWWLAGFMVISLLFGIFGLLFSFIGLGILHFQLKKKQNELLSFSKTNIDNAKPSKTAPGRYSDWLLIGFLAVALFLMLAGIVVVQLNTI